MVKQVTIESGMDYRNFLNDIRKLGALRVGEKKDNGNKVVFLRERTWKEWFAEKFNGNDSAVKKSQQAVVDALKPIIENSEYPDQLFQNVKDRVDHGSSISGRALQRDYKPVLKGERPVPLRGGTIAAISKGNSVQFLEADPAKIKCSHAVLRSSTAFAEASEHPLLKGQRIKLKDFFFPSNNNVSQWGSQPIPVRVSDTHLQVNYPAASWACITELTMPNFGAGKATIPETDFIQLLTKAVKGQQGAVVIEIIPDHLEELHGAKTFTYTDEGLKAQIGAAQTLVAEAKDVNKALVITFACKDKEVMARMQTLMSVPKH